MIHGGDHGSGKSRVGNRTLVQTRRVTDRFPEYDPGSFRVFGIFHFRDGEDPFL